ncbi:MAG: hypothetical protein GX882_01960 [Methanomicrobiales archaeon]|nr:hypothetical protein [Methanomicrobiales archaeon]
MGYEYIAITDHSSRVRPEALESQRAGIERVNRRHACQLLAGSEVDIRSDGSLGYLISSSHRSTRGSARIWMS